MIVCGAYRFKVDENNHVGVIKEGDRYRLYNYQIGRESGEMYTKAEAEKLLGQMKAEVAQVAAKMQQNGMRSHAAASVNSATKNNISGNNSADVNNKGGTDSVKEQLANNLEKLNNMPVVSTVEAEGTFSSKQELVEWILEKLEYTGYRISREGFGEIILDRKRISKGLSYLKTTEEQMAFLAVPDVLSKGELIGSHKKHKQRAYDTVTFAAPVEINGVRGNMAVVVRQEGENYYKVHRLILPNGAKFIFQRKGDIAETAGGVDNNSGLSPTDNISNNIIPENEANVNKNSENIVEGEENSASDGSADTKTSRVDSINPKKIHEYLRENVKGYKALSEPNQAMVRAIIRQGRTLGIPEADLLLYAKVATRSGVNIVFDKEATYLGKDGKTGNDVYADGFYQRSQNRIVVNPKGSRSAERLLIHELTHAIFKTPSGTIILMNGVKNLSQDEKDRITKNYSKLHKNSSGGEISLKIMDEQNAAYAEGVLSDRAILEKLVSDKPKLKDMILDFFTKAKSDYSGEDKLDAAAKRLYRQYKKLFDEFSARNADTNAVERTVRGKSDERSYALDENLGDQLQEWLNNGEKKGKKFNGTYFDLGTTPDVFVRHGAKKVKMIMYEDVVAKVTGMKGDNAHTISLDEISKLPSQLNDPILLFSGNIQNSYVALTELTNKYGHDVIVAVHINKGSENRSQITKIASLYSKTNDFGNNKIISYVDNQIEQGRLIDASIKKAPNWFTTRGLQLPKAVQTILDANNIISQKTEKSNSFSKKNSKKIPTRISRCRVTLIGIRLRRSSQRRMTQARRCLMRMR